VCLPCKGSYIFFSFYKILLIRILTESKNNEEKVEIVSRVKKEELIFYPGQLLYAESDGNYVVFYLREEQ